MVFLILGFWLSSSELAAQKRRKIKEQLLYIIKVNKN